MKYNKLVRDKIPEIISSQGDKPITRVLTLKSFRLELKRKLHEEVAEFSSSDSIEELVDVLEVVYALAKDEGFSQYQLEKMRRQKKRDRGGFHQKVFLEEVIPSVP